MHDVDKGQSVSQYQYRYRDGYVFRLPPSLRIILRLQAGTGRRTPNGRREEPTTHHRTWYSVGQVNV